MKRSYALLFIGLTLFFAGCKPPAFSPAPGAYVDQVSVTLSADSGDTIYYTLDGTTPSAASQEYSSPILLDEVNTETMIKAIAINDLFNLKSRVSSGGYSIISSSTQVATPQFSITQAVYDTPVSVQISCATEGAVIYYALGGAEPTNSSDGYTEPIAFNNEGSFTLKAIAYKNHLEPSEVATVEFEIDWGKVTRPIIRPVSGIYDSDVYVEIETTSAGASTYYTIGEDGAIPPDPDDTSSLYPPGTPIIANSSNSTLTIKAISYKDFMEHSDISTEWYTIDTDGNLNETTNFEPGDDQLNGWEVWRDDDDLDWGFTDYRSHSGDFAFRVGKSDCWGAICSDDNLTLTKTFVDPLPVTRVEAYVYKLTGSTLGTGQLEVTYDGSNWHRIGGSDALSSFITTGDNASDWTFRSWDINGDVLGIRFSYRKITRYDNLYIDDITIISE